MCSDFALGFHKSSRLVFKITRNQVKTLCLGTTARRDRQANYRVSPLLSTILMEAQGQDLWKPSVHRPCVVLAEILYGTFFSYLFHRMDDFSSPSFDISLIES